MGTWAYISGKALVPMLQLLHVPQLKQLEALLNNESILSQVHLKPLYVCEFYYTSFV